MNGIVECRFILCRMRAFVSNDFTRAVLLLVVCAAAGGGVEAAVTDLRLPSISTGGGTLAVRASFPSSPIDFRYGIEGGAPVVVYVPGGFEAGDLDSSQLQPLVDQGFVVLTFVFPGGPGSDGEYDDRGDLSQQGLRDVLRFATGEIRDSRYRTLSDIAGGRARTDLVGMYVSSNGGSIGIATLGRYGHEINPLAFIFSFESPTNDQVLATEIGQRDYDPDPGTDADGDGITYNDVVNGAVRAYGFPQIDVDYNRLAYDAAATMTLTSGTQTFQYTGLFYFDNNEDGVFNVSDPQRMVTDVNGNGAIDADEDYPMPGLTVIDTVSGQPKAVLSVAAAIAAASRNLASPWPSHYYPVHEVVRYWEIRDGTAWFAEAMANQPDLAGMSAFTFGDHVQTSKEYHHIHHYNDGFRFSDTLGRSHWFRLNPDRAYVEAVAGASVPEATDNDANAPVTPSQMQSLTEPEIAAVGGHVMVGACCEMADRCYYDRWENNLSAVITGPASPPTPHWMTFALNCHDFVNPADSAAAVRFFLDTLEAHGARGDLYITAPVLEAWETSAPALVARLRGGTHTVSYHVRPPHPVVFEPTNALLNSTPLADYERYRLDLRTGQVNTAASGGIYRVASVLAKTPSATGLNALTTQWMERFAAAMAARGCRVGVFDHGPVAGRSGFENLVQPREGLYPRPVDYFLERVDASGHPDTGGNFWWNLAADGTLSSPALAAAFQTDFLDASPGDERRPAFGLCAIHENNFYAEGTPWGPIYYNDAAMTQPKPPPYDLSTTAAWVTMRPEIEKTRIRQAFRALVAAATADSDTRVVTSRDIASHADAQFDERSILRQVEQHNEGGDFERPTPPVYAWQQGTTTTSPFGGTFAIEPAAAFAGTMGLRVTANPGAQYTVAQRVDIDKAHEYRFGAQVKGANVGAVRIALIPVTLHGSNLLPVAGGEAYSTPPLTGTFNWTAVTGVGYVTENFHFMLLQVEIENGGIVFVDDAFVRSAQDAPMAVPATVAKPVEFTVLVHSEDVPQLESDTEYFRAKTRLLQDLGDMFARHGAYLMVQPELELASGTQTVAGYSDFFRDLHDNRACRFSVHTHGPKGNPTLPEILDYVSYRRTYFESLGVAPVTDLNGNFDVDDHSVFRDVGFLSLSAFKNVFTQAGYRGRYFHPWQPSPGNPYGDEAGWATDDPSGLVVYIPGSCTEVTKHSERLRHRVWPGLTQALWNSELDRPTTWYFITHVDAFRSRTGLSYSQYMQSPEYQQDLQAYEDLFFDVLDPLAARGFIRLATLDEMREAFEAWEYPWTAARPRWPLY